MPKVISSLAIGGMVALSLVACSAPQASGCAVTPSGSASSKVVVTGAAGAEPTVTIPAPLDAKVTERSVVTEGDGKVAEDGQVAVVHLVMYNAATGERLQATNYSAAGQLVPIDATAIVPGFYKSLHCSTEGERIVAVIPPSDLFGAEGIPNEDGGYAVGPTDSVVFVFDITKVEPAPTGSPSAAPLDLPTPGEWTENVPDVDLSGDAPVVTLPDIDPPAELLLQVLTEGDGDVVTSDSTVTIDYQLVLWSTGGVKEQTFGTGQPATFPATGVIKGFAAAMVGQKVGATVLVTIPPEYAYGTDPDAHELGGQTLVFLIEIHAIS